MRLAVLVVGVIGCGSGVRPVDEAHVAGRNALVDAANDPVAMERLFRESITNGGLWFDDPACKPFSVPAELRHEQLAAFARCLVGLHLQPSTREDALGDVVVMKYAPGIEIEARVAPESAGPHLSWIGYESRREIDALIPTIDAAALDSIRVTGDRDGPLDPSLGATLELGVTTHAAFAWIRLCVDETGTVTLAHPFETSSSKAAAAFEAAAMTWTFRPFTIRDQIVPICSMVRMTYPPARHPTVETLPLPPPMSRTRREPLVFGAGAPGALLIQGQRIAGEKLIMPDDETKTEIQASGRVRIVGSFRVCLDDTGRVESVLPLRSTGFAAYDRKLTAGILRWRYSPYLVNDQPVPVCTGVAYIYSQD